MIADVILEKKTLFFLIWEKNLKKIFKKFWENLYIFFNDSDWKGLLFARILKNLFRFEYY